MTTAVSTTSGAAAPMSSQVILPAGARTGYSALGAADFLKLLTTQMQNQDPTAPVDNKEMLAQMAQFSTLSQTTDNGTTLQAIAAKLDTLIAQNAALQSASTPSSSTPAA